MARAEHPIHGWLADHVARAGGPTVVELGCGEGSLLRAVRARSTDCHLLGVDSAARALRAAASRVDLGSAAMVIRADLDAGVPVASGSVDVVVSHNVLECLAEPAALLREAARVLRPGGLAIWSHVDFDAIVCATDAPELTRRILHAHSDAVPSWQTYADGAIGRKLAGLVTNSPLTLAGIDTHVLTANTFDGLAAERLLGVADTLRNPRTRARERVEPADLDAWLASISRAAASQTFFFAETTFLAVGRKRA